MESITDGADGMILADAADATGLANIIVKLYENQALRISIGAKAALTARDFTWSRNGQEFTMIFNDILSRNARTSAHDGDDGERQIGVADANNSPRS